MNTNSVFYLFIYLFYPFSLEESPKRIFLLREAVLQSGQWQLLQVAFLSLKHEKWDHTILHTLLQHTTIGW